MPYYKCESCSFIIFSKDKISFFCPNCRGRMNEVEKPAKKKKLKKFKCPECDVEFEYETRFFKCPNCDYSPEYDYF